MEFGPLCKRYNDPCTYERGKNTRGVRGRRFDILLQEKYKIQGGKESPQQIIR